MSFPCKCCGQQYENLTLVARHIFAQDDVKHTKWSKDWALGYIKRAKETPVVAKAAPPKPLTQLEKESLVLDSAFKRTMRDY